MSSEAKVFSTTLRQKRSFPWSVLHKINANVAFQLLKALLRWPVLSVDEAQLQDQQQNIPVNIRPNAGKQKDAPIQLRCSSTYKLRIHLQLRGPNRVGHPHQFFMRSIAFFPVQSGSTLPKVPEEEDGWLAAAHRGFGHQKDLGLGASAANHRKQQICPSAL